MSCRLLDNCLHPAYSPISQPDLDPVRMIGRVGKYRCDDSTGQLSRGLILLEDDIHGRADPDVFPAFPVSHGRPVWMQHDKSLPAPEDITVIPGYPAEVTQPINGFLPECFFSEIMAIKITEVKDVKTGKNPHNVDARVIYDTEHAMVVHILLKPGESLRRHITPVDVAFYVLEGKGIVEIGQDRLEAGPDMIIESPARVPHRWINDGPGVFRVLVMKVPKPKENTVIL